MSLDLRIEQMMRQLRSKSFESDRELQEFLRYHLQSAILDRTHELHWGFKQSMEFIEQARHELNLAYTLLDELKSMS